MMAGEKNHNVVYTGSCLHNDDANASMCEQKKCLVHIFFRMWKYFLSLLVSSD